MKKYNIKKISQIDKNELQEFYKNTFNNRNASLIQNYNWCYRLGYNNFEPLVLLIDNKIIGHAGLIPADINIKGKNNSAIWFTDFAIVPEYRQQGFGKILTKEWMNICPLQITYCNDSSLKVFKKVGWKVTFSTKRVIKPINYFKVTPFLKKIRINFGDTLVRSLLKKKLEKYSAIKPIKINENFITNISKFEKENCRNKSTYLIRDENWFKWRLLDCPYREELFFFENDGDYLVAHIFNHKNLKRLNILYTFCKKKDDEILNMVFKWSIENNIDFIWYLTNKKMNYSLFSYLFRKPLNFAYNSSEPSNLLALSNGFVNSEAIDSDTDFASMES